MDKIDLKILDILRDDASLTNCELAARVHLSPSSCLRRVQKLKRKGIIKKTIAVIDETVLGRNLKAIVEVDLDRHGNRAQAVFHERVKKEQAVRFAYGVTGESDALLIMDLIDMDEYRQVCDRLFNFDDNIIRFRTSFAMKTIKE